MESSMTCGQMIKFSLSKLLYELFGTMVLTMLYIGGSQSVILAGLWIMTIFCWKISGSHFNPAISIVYIFRKDKGGLPRGLALTYALAQFLGALLGAYLMLFFALDLMPVYLVDGKKWAVAMTQEIFGTMIFVFFFMTQTEEKMLFSNEKAINCFIIASSYVAARAIFFGAGVGTITTYGACMNPAMALGICFASIFGEFAKDAFKWFWLYTFFPFIGSILALIFYEFVYKKTQEMLNHDEEVDQNNNEEYGATPDGTLD